MTILEHLQKQIDEHEKRIVKLENQIGSPKLEPTKPGQPEKQTVKL